MRVSHEAIYQALYVQGRGALRRELTACLRTGRALRIGNRFCLFFLGFGLGPGLLQRAVDASDEERRRIAVNLHDGSLAWRVPLGIVEPPGAAGRRCWRSARSSAAHRSGDPPTG